jgi:hypothetical protein
LRVAGEEEMRAELRSFDGTGLGWLDSLIFRVQALKVMFGDVY